jgi:hypothetical protein
MRSTYLGASFTVPPGAGGALEENRLFGGQRGSCAKTSVFGTTGVPKDGLRRSASCILPGLEILLLFCNQSSESLRASHLILRWSSARGHRARVVWDFETTSQILTFKTRMDGPCCRPEPKHKWCRLLTT